MTNKKFGIIYIAINIKTNKSYIGYTVRKLNTRITEHYSVTARYNYKFANALKKI